jgi:hypothetical protein
MQSLSTVPAHSSHARRHRSMWGTCAMATILASLLAAAPAGAAPWSAPAPIPGSLVESFPVLAVGPFGPRAVYWTGSGRPVDPAAAPPTFVSRLGPGLRPGPAQTLTGSFQLGTGDIAVDLATVDARDRVVLPGFGRQSSEPGLLATGPLSGPMTLRDLARPVRSIAVNAAGDAAVGIEACATRRCHPASPGVVLRRHGHRLGRPIALDRPGFGHGMAVAIDPRGRVLAVWDRNDRIYTRFVGARGHLGRRRALGREPAPPVFRAALPGDGRAALAWSAQVRGETGAGSPFTATVALAGPSGTFGHPHLLETVPLLSPGSFGLPPPGIALRLPRGAPGLIAWTGVDPTGNVVRVSTIRGTTLESPQTVSAPGSNALLADAAAGPRGEAVVLLRPGAGSNSPTPSTGFGGLEAVTRGPGSGPFGAPETIVPSPSMPGIGDAEEADVAIDAASDTVLAVWRTGLAPITWSVRASLATSAAAT